ncbi:hypothetical protein [Pseudonocardia kunmingensis]|uniref:Extracellular solute-binding protein (Family 5) n=1 Tax=Pseudonocardia kunmingensis TaxID=630975 RepID=A0A543DPW6_9PSEU|nr:hypothetical protein [Pseudonocardia kunmingensis]TQM11348.1 hypothetical protein FB558_3907 [Pseudonocardia kunmingensis]
MAGPTAGITLRDNYLLPSRYPGPTPPGFQEAVSRSFETALTDEERVATLRQASEIAVNEAMDLFLCALPTQIAYSDRMIGAESMGHSDFQGVFDLRYAGIAAD